MMRAALLLALLLLPVVAADHVYSHRVYVVGRVLDVDARPAAGVPIELAFEGISARTGCFDNDPEVTGSRGDFTICRHTHAIADNASVLVRAGNASRRVAIDPDLRHASAHLQLDAPALHDVNGERQFARTFTVTGRAFALVPDAIEEEGVPVNATPIFDNVTVELRVLDRVLTSGTAKPNEHGLYRIDLDITEIPASATVRARVGRDIGEESASPVFRRADVNVVRDLRLIDGPGDDAPGSTPTPLPPWMVLAALVVTAACVGRARRRRPEGR